MLAIGKTKNMDRLFATNVEDSEVLSGIKVDVEPLRGTPPTDGINSPLTVGKNKTKSQNATV